jgi:iron complex outermembrane recepter protein
MTTMPRRAITTLLLASTGLMPLGGTAFAQAQPIALGEIVVEADEAGTPGAATVQTTAGSKLPIAVTRVPQSVSVVDRQQLDELPGTAKLDETLRYSAGVNAGTYGTDADTDWYFIRGFQAEQTGMFLDGLPLYQTGFGTFLTDPFLLDRVEVLKGPASVLYGGANVGGIVNMVSKRPTGERLRYTETGINNFGNAYAGFDIGDGNEEGNLSYRLTGKVSGGGWETEDAEDLRGVIAGSVMFEPTDATSFTLYGTYQNVDLDHTSTGFLPYEGTVVDRPGVGRIPRDFNYGDPGQDIYERQQAAIGYELEHDLNGDWTIKQNLRYATVSLDEEYLYVGGWAGPTELSRFGFGHDTEVRSFNADTRIEGRFDTGPLSHEFLAGFDYKNYYIDQELGFSFAPPIDVLNPVYGVALPALSTYQDNTISMQQAGIYAQDQISLGGLIATLNGRYDWIETELDDRLPGQGVSTSSEGAFTGRVGLGYEFDNGLTPYVSYATSFNPSLVVDGDGGLFEPETGRQWEVGVKYEPSFFDGLITASFFDLTRDNVVGTVPGSVPAVQQAIGEINVKGIELEAQANLGDFKVLGALTYLEAEVITATGSVPAGNSPVQIPDLTASLWLDYTIPEGVLQGVSIGGGIRYMGSSWADEANTLEVPAATVFDAGLRYEQDDWGVALKVSNIFDNEYVSSCLSPTSCGYGAGRTATLSLHKSW